MPDGIANLLTNAQLMVEALAAADNSAEVSTNGGTEEFVTAGRTTVTLLEGLNNQQEELKADLKLKTAEVNDAQRSLRDWYSKASRIVKLAYWDQQEKWVEFGLTAKR